MTSRIVLFKLHNLVFSLKFLKKGTTAVVVLRMCVLKIRGMTTMEKSIKVLLRYFF